MRRKRWLSALTLLAVGVICGIAIDRSIASWAPSGEVQSAVPNVDFSVMTIATKPVIAKVYGTTTMVRIQAWERCALGYATCNAPRRAVEAQCLGNQGTLLIDEAEWPAFQRLRGEDLQGALNLPTDMRLCSTFEQSTAP